MVTHLRAKFSHMQGSLEETELLPEMGYHIVFFFLFDIK